MKIRVDHLPWYASSEDLRKLCAPFGEVLAATVMFDWNTHRSLGFGIVSMAEGMYNLNKLKVELVNPL